MDDSAQNVRAKRARRAHDVSKRQRPRLEVLAEWTTPLRGYNERIRNLVLGGGLNGATRLNSSTVLDDGSTDFMHGGDDVLDFSLDWFWSFPDDIINLDVGERIR